MPPEETERCETAASKTNELARTVGLLDAVAGRWSVSGIPRLVEVIPLNEARRRNCIEPKAVLTRLPRFGWCPRNYSDLGSHRSLRSAGQDRFGLLRHEGPEGYLQQDGPHRGGVVGMAVL